MAAPHAHSSLNILFSLLHYPFPLYSIFWLLSDYHLWQRADNVEMMS